MLKDKCRSGSRPGMRTRSRTGNVAWSLYSAHRRSLIAKMQQMTQPARPGRVERP